MWFHDVVDVHVWHSAGGQRDGYRTMDFRTWHANVTVHQWMCIAGIVVLCGFST
jgi:hypothetical protein